MINHYPSTCFQDKNRVKFEVYCLRPVTVTNVEHIIDNDEYSLKPQKKNYWEITFHFHDSYQSASYRLDTTPNLLSKYSIFVGEAVKIVPDANKALHKLIGKSMMIRYTKTYILDVAKKTYSVDWYITGLQPIEGDTAINN